MAVIVHHEPANSACLWKMHVWQAAWDGNNVWDVTGTSGEVVDFQLPTAPDPRKLQFKFHCTFPATGLDSWEPDDFIRRLFLVSPAEVWTFESSPRVLYRNPFPAGVLFNPGDVLTFQAITQNAFVVVSSMSGILTIRRSLMPILGSRHVTTSMEYPLSR